MKIKPSIRMSVQAKIAVSAVLAVVSLAGVLSCYFRSEIGSEARDALTRRAVAVAASLAGECEYGLLSGNKALLQRIVIKALSQSDVVSAVIFDEQGRMMAAAGQVDYAAKNKAGVEIAQRFKQAAASTFQIENATGGTQWVYTPVHLQPALTPVSEPGLESSVESSSEPARQIGQTLGVLELGISESATMLRVRETGWTALWLTGSLALLAGLVCVFVVRHVTRPLRQFVAGFEQLLAGKWQARVTCDSNDEFGDLARGFNCIVQAVEKSLKDTAARHTPSHGPAVVPEVLTAGQKFADFEIISKIGEGGMGAVYKARQTALNRIVALKILPPALAQSSDFITRFQREAQAAARLSYPNIVQVYQAGTSEGIHYIAMEFVAGESLRDRLERFGRLDPREAVALCLDVARALDHAWRQARIVHRDIKPDNIFIAVNGQVKVGDLGLAKKLDEKTLELTATGTPMGSPYYVSPEQARGVHDVDFRADIYSLGCTLYQMLTAQHPYEGTNAMAVMMQHVQSPAPSIQKHWPGCPPAVVALLDKMLAKDRDQRHQSYDALISELQQAKRHLDKPSAKVVVRPGPPPLRS